MAEKTEKFSVPVSGWRVLEATLEINGHSPGGDYSVTDGKAGFFFKSLVKLVTTSEPGVKAILLENGATSRGEVRLEDVVPTKVEELVVRTKAPREKVIAAIEASEGGYKYRHDLNFHVEKVGDTVRITPLGDDRGKWEDLSSLINSGGSENPISVADSEESRQKAKV